MQNKKVIPFSPKEEGFIGEGSEGFWTSAISYLWGEKGVKIVIVIVMALLLFDLRNDVKEIKKDLDETKQKVEELDKNLISIDKTITEIGAVLKIKLGYEIKN